MKETVHSNSTSSSEIKKPVLKEKRDGNSQDIHSEDWIESLHQEQLPSIQLSSRNIDQPEFLTTKEENKFRVKLQVFEGPLELLLNLVKEHELNINDIPITFITNQLIKDPHGIAYKDANLYTVLTPLDELIKIYLK